jgi:hypothetical protein
MIEITKIKKKKFAFFQSHNAKKNVIHRIIADILHKFNSNATLILLQSLCGQNFLHGWFNGNGICFDKQSI